MERIMSKNDDNFKRYQDRLVKLQEETTDGVLVPPPELPIDRLISYLANEGMKLLEAEEAAKKTTWKKKEWPKLPDETPALNSSLAKNDKNPYVRARAMVLAKMSPAKKKELAEMEKSGNINNTVYDKFVAEVVRVGTELQNGK
jgi:hypothetical protein